MSYRKSIVFLVAVTLCGCGGGEKKGSGAKAAGEQFQSTNVPKPKGTANETPEPEVDPGGSDPDVPPTPSLTMDQAIRDLTHDDGTRRLDAVNFIANSEYDAAIGETVASGLVRRLADSQKGTRVSAVIALRKWVRADDVGAISGLLARNDDDIRHRAIEVLSNIDSSEAVEHIAMRLTTAFDRKEAKLGLLAMGGIAEPVLVDLYVEDTDPEVRLAVVEILHEVGGNDSIEPLIELQADSDPRVATAAAKALLAVESR